MEQVRIDLKRLLTDITHHFQRLHDLAYDEVEIELGGSGVGSAPPTLVRVPPAKAGRHARRGAGVADRNRLESGRWQRCQPRVRIPPPLLDHLRQEPALESGLSPRGSGRTAVASSARRPRPPRAGREPHVDPDQQPAAPERPPRRDVQDRQRRPRSRVIVVLSALLATGAVAATPKAHTHQPWRRRARMWRPQTRAGMPTRASIGRGKRPAVSGVQRTRRASARPGRGRRSGGTARRTRASSRAGTVADQHARPCPVPRPCRPAPSR